MKVGLATDFYFPWIGGPSTVVRNLGYGLSSRGHAVSLLAPSANGLADRHADGPMEVWRAPTVPVPFGYQLRATVRGGPAAKRWIEEFQPDVINVHHPFALSLSAQAAARRREIPVVATNHTIPDCSLWGLRRAGPVYHVAHYAMSRWLVRFLSRANAVTTPTVTAAEALHDLGFPQPVEAISNGIDIQRFSPGPASDDLRAALGLDRRPLVLYTGRLDAEKQMDVWLHAAAAVTRLRDVQFAVGGKGTDRSRLERLAAGLGLAQSVKFIGYVDDDQLPALYRLADVFFVTSPVELQCLTALEAAASGLPILAADAAALPEIVRHGENGYLFFPGDGRMAAELLTSLLSDGALRLKMGDRSRELALAHSLDETVNRYEQLFQSIRGRPAEFAA